jgi:hypothetical protein
MAPENAARTLPTTGFTTGNGVPVAASPRIRALAVDFLTSAKAKEEVSRLLVEEEASVLASFSMADRVIANSEAAHLEFESDDSAEFGMAHIHPMLESILVELEATARNMPVPSTRLGFANRSLLRRRCAIIEQLKLDIAWTRSRLMYLQVGASNQASNAAELEDELQDALAEALIAI